MSLRLVAREDAVERSGFVNPNIPKISHGHRRNLIEYFGEASGNLGPDVTDVHMTNRSIGAHSHEVDEFQILLGVPGSTFEGKPVPSLLVHYSDAFSVYGPLEGAETPLRLIQIRAEPIDHAKGGDWGDFRVPGDVELMPYIGDRHAEGIVPDLSEHDSLEAGDIKSETLIGPSDDGMGALIITAGKGTKFSLPSSQGTSGQSTYVVNGSIHFNGRLFGEQAVGWQDGGEPEVDVQAGNSGCRILVMHFPFPCSKVVRANASSDVAARVAPFINV